VTVGPPAVSGRGAAARSPASDVLTDPRRPKQDRSRLTRQRMLEAAVTCLARSGFAGATMGAIAAEAGISRGAVQHHFPVREELMTAALEHTFEQRTATLADLEVPEGERVEFVVDLLVTYYTDDLFKAALQLWTAAAGDDVLRARLIPLERRFAREVHEQAVRLLGVDDSDPHTRSLIQATLDLARGLGLADVLTDDSRRRTGITQAWAAELRRALGTKHS
jgi:AcrR family transcriptional regulator